MRAADIPLGVQTLHSVMAEAMCCTRAGAAGGHVSDDEGRRIMKEVIKRLPGFLVPKLVREIGGQPGKTPIDLHLHP